MKKQLLVLAMTFAVTFLNAQTNVSGNISQNTSWTIAGSPYVINGVVTVLQGDTLTIEPGVVVKRTGFKSQESMIVQGTLIAIGQRFSVCKNT